MTFSLGTLRTGAFIRRMLDAINVLRMLRGEAQESDEQFLENIRREFEPRRSTESETQQRPATAQEVKVSADETSADEYVDVETIEEDFKPLASLIPDPPMDLLEIKMARIHGMLRELYNNNLPSSITYEPMTTEELYEVLSNDD